MPRDVVSALDKADLILDRLGEAGERIRERADEIANPTDRLRYVVGAIKRVRDEVERSRRYRQAPVDVRTFVESPDYMDKRGVLWPAVMAELEKMTTGGYVEAVLTGGIGTAKTTLALYAQAYELYKILLLQSPHSEFDLDPASEIVIVFQSVTGATAKGVDYQRFRSMIGSSPWFAKNAPFDQNYESEMRFPRRVIVRPISSSETGAIGENVVGGIIDEINFMAIVEKSARAIDGGTYDQAMQNYHSIARRRESRFMNQGELAGLLCLVSSARYPGQFTDRKKAEAELPGARIFVYDKRRWEVRPEAFGTARFRVYAGSPTDRPRILEPDEKVKPDEAPAVIEVPEEYRHQFEVDIYNALRDIAGMSTIASNAYMPRPDLIAAAFSHGESVFSVDETDFSDTLKLRLDALTDPKEDRWVHVDLGATGDACGLAVGHVRRFVVVDREGEKEVLPEIVIDGVLRITPPNSGEIQFEKVRSIIYTLSANGVKIRWVSYDSWQSRDSMQILRSRGYTTGEVSMDRDNRAYDLTKQAIYDGRLIAPRHETCASEFRGLIRESKKNKIDHPADGSKDCSDAVAGVVSGLVTRREIWVRHKVPPGKALASLVRNHGKEEAA